MFVCVFAKKFPALASQSCCEVSRPRAVGEYEYRLFSFNIYFQRKSGICCNPGCKSMGKMPKRLDKHLSRCHKGVSRAMNDKYRMSSPSSDLGVTCLLPGYGKKICHLPHHWKSMHSLMRVTPNHSEVGEKLREKRSRQLLEEWKDTSKNKEKAKKYI